jgi:hypothetical protein
LKEEQPMTNRESLAPALPARELPGQADTAPVGQGKGFSRWQSRPFWFLSTAAAGVLLTLGLTLMVEQVVQVSHQASSFCQDYIAAQRLAQGTPIYLPLSSLAQCPLGLYRYDAHPPPSVVFALPLALLPYAAASLLWGFCLLAAYLASGVLLLRELGWLSLRGLALFVIGSIYWQPSAGAGGEQNLWQLLLLLMVVAWVLERRGYLAPAGVLLGGAWLLKLWTSALLLGAVARREWRQALSGGLTIVVGTLLTAAVVGPGTYGAYLGPVQNDEVLWVPVNGNMSVAGVITRLFTGDLSLLPPVLAGVPLKGAVLLGEAAAGLLLLGVVTFIGWCRWKASGEAVGLLSPGLLATITPLVFPLTWFFSFITLLLPFTTTILALRQTPRPPRWWFGVLGLSLLPLVAPDISLSLGVWILGQHVSGAAWWATFAFASPSLGVLGFAGTQGYLLWQKALQRRDTEQARQ